MDHHITVRGLLDKVIKSFSNDLETSPSNALSNFYHTNQRLTAAQSGGGGHGSFSGFGSMMECFTIDICPDLLLGAIAAAAAVAFVLIYQGITMAVRRRKRSENVSEDFFGRFQDIFYIGLEEFEQSIEQVAHGNYNNSWIGKLYDQFSSQYDLVDDQQKNGPYVCKKRFWDCVDRTAQNSVSQPGGFSNSTLQFFQEIGHEKGKMCTFTPHEANPVIECIEEHGECMNKIV